ncbi:helicase-associated domain-containing protein [Georgenia deserti]|uniref:Helicase-associated domain-containing protein n=1 Tax=Georgenia deserti TaxID=2093781 RepID=A0ABW4L1E6_9MICO
MAPTAGTQELAAALDRRDDASLAALLEARPDLATPAPSSLTSLAARAASRPSVERALAGLNAVELAVAETVTALAPLDRADREAVSRAVGLDAGPALARLEDLALTVDAAPLAGLPEALGPHPAGLGPTLAELDASFEQDGPPAPTDAESLRAVLDGAPSTAVRTLEALTWGPPVGTTAQHVPEGADWLLTHGVLRRLSPTQLVLPREVGLAARDGRTWREPPRPPEPDYRSVPATVVDAEGARAGEEVVRLVGALLATWREEPAKILRAGGVGVRELRRTAGALDVEEHQAAVLAELAGMAGLLGQDGDDQPVWVPARSAHDWADDTLPLQWAQLALAWFDSARAPWLVGTRENDALRSVLEPTLERGWAVELRRRVLDALAEIPAGHSPTPEQVHELLAWQRPRATAPESTVAAVLEEAALLGLTGAGALTSAGRELLASRREDAVAEAFAGQLPEPVGELLVQGDLTGVVPGRPEPDLGALLERCAEVESRGSGLTVRFTPASVRRALDAGMGADELLAQLAEYSRTPLPQALEYLVRDAARRHGQVRVGAAQAYLTVADEALGAELVANPSLASLSLTALAPTVLVSGAAPADVLRVLRQAGLGPVPEGANGVMAVPARRRPGAVPTHPGAAVSTYTRRPDPEDLGRTIARMRAGEEQVRRDVECRSVEGPVATDPVHALELLRTSAAAGEEVEIVVVGALGTTERRRVRPLSVDGGRVRVADLDREVELTVAVHRITSVATPSTA